MSINQNQKWIEEIESYEEMLGEPRKFIEEFCYIKTKEGKFEKFKLNKPQKRLMEIVERKLEEKKPIRVKILKARQMGFSTLISALGFWWTAMNENSSYAVVAHKNKSASSIFDKHKIFYDNLPKGMKPRIDKFNSEQISFNTGEGDGLRSNIFFGTAGGGELFRGETILFMHKSEVAFWEDKDGVLKKALNATVPYVPFSAIFEETTAKGYNEFKDGWDKSVRGGDGYEALFVGWHEMEEYRLEPEGDFELTEKELELQMDYDLTDAQLNWRRHKINNDFDGEMNWFMQEYPLTAEEAFLSSGYGVFDGETIKKGYLYSRKPKRQQKIESVMIKEKLKVWEEPEEKEIKKYNQKTRWNEENQEYEYYDGDILEEEKTVYANYTVGVDTAGMGANWNQIVVWHNVKKIMVARLGVKILNENKLAKVIVEIAKFYNNALVIPEVNFSHALCDYMLELGYKNIYLLENISKINKTHTQMEYGWKTTQSTKPVIISNLRTLVDENPGAIPDKEFWYEAEYYVMEDKEKNKMNAASGHQDDIIIANAVGLYGCNSFQAKQNYSVVKECGVARAGVGIGIGKEKGKKLRKGVYTNNA